MKVNDVIREYARSRRFMNLSDSSKRNYMGAIRDLEETIGDMDIEAVRRRDLIRHFESMADRPATANNYGRVASIIFNYAVDMEYCGGNPAQRLTPMKVGTWRQWKMDDVFKVIGMKHPIVSTAVALGYYTGQREADILKMRWDDIQNGVLKVTQSKTGTVLEIAVAKPLQRILDSINKDGPFIVRSTTGKPMTGPAFRNMFKRKTREIGVDAPFHGLRKSVGSRLAEQGRSVNEIAAVLGHKTLTMAALYTKQADNKKLIASAVNALADD